MKIPNIQSLRFAKTIFFILPICLLQAGNLRADQAEEVFEQFHDRIYQILVINKASDTKVVIGSGFQIGAEGILATNFHVVADFIHHPDKYELQYLDYENKTGNLSVVDVDVISDLALVKQTTQDISRSTALKLAEQAVSQGEEIYALGNPHDLGMTVVPGTYNAAVSHSFYERLLFSGSLNPGMSGGPTLNRRGEVVGVNVATAGNQISFLVPLAKIRGLLENYQESNSVDLKQRIREQLSASQEKMFSQLLAAEWPKKSLGQTTVLGEMEHFVRCWGRHEDEDPKQKYRAINIDCSSNERIFLSSNFTTGHLQYEFYWFETEELNSFQFYNVYSGYNRGARAVNYAREEDVTEFKCHEDFVADKTHSSEDGDGASPVVVKATLCARAYKQYSGLFDLLFIGATVHDSGRALVSHFSIAGIDKEHGLAFARKFMEQVTWP